MKSDATLWKAKLYDAIRKAETLDTVDKSEVEPLANELNGLMDDLDKHIKFLGGYLSRKNDGGRPKETNRYIISLVRLIRLSRLIRIYSYRQ